jgi:hypothetical protein
MSGSRRVALCAIAGAALAGLVSPYLRHLFAVPTGGVGAVTVSGYPKGWDYAVVALLIFGAVAGGAVGALTARRAGAHPLPPAPSRRGVLPTALVVFLLMLFVHDHPFVPMDPFHEGEHLTAGYLMKSGERPFRDFYIFHGLATDAGLDALAFSLGDHPSPLRVRRLQTVLDAATLALLVPIAAEVSVTSAAMVIGVFVSLCGAAAFWLPVFPYYRLAPVLLAVLGLVRYARNGGARPLFLAFASSTLGLLWSLDTGSYALAGTVVSLVLFRLTRLESRALPIRRLLLLAVIALMLPLIVLLLVRADIRQFAVDSFVIMPRAIDATWALPAPQPFTEAGMRYFLPPVLYGFLLAYALLAIRRRDSALAARLIVLTTFSIFLFRTASGRVSWSHTRFAVPLLGIAVVAFIVEPLWLSKKRLAVVLLAVPLFFYFELGPNTVSAAKLIAGWRARQRHEGLVAYPTKAGRGIYASPENAADLAALSTAIDALGPQNATILDFSNERALYYLLQRKPPLRCMEISMLSNETMLAEAMGQLNAHPPLAVVVSGYPEIAAFDGVSNRQRVPQLATWIDVNYPKRMQIGRFVLATR